VVGKNTVASIQSGVVYGYVGLVDGICERMSEELGFSPKVVATGGLAPLIAGISKAISEVDEHLTLEGLRLLHERNR
jgi:type III pantothenate kinase